MVPPVWLTKPLPASRSRSVRDSRALVLVDVKEFFFDCGMGLWPARCVVSGPAWRSLEVRVCQKERHCVASLQRGQCQHVQSWRALHGSVLECDMWTEKLCMETYV